MAALFFWFLAGLETLSSGAEEHTFQQLIGCTFSSAGPVGRFWIYGYNQRDIMHVDLEEEGVAARSDAGSFMVEERRSKLYFKSKEMRLMRICSAVQTVFSLSNSSLSRAVRPTVQVSLAGEEGRRYLACTVRGFYPNVIRVRWVHRGKKVFFGTTTTGLLPQKDGTFQITNYLMLENGTAESFFCETEHVSIEGKLKLRLGGSIQKKKSLSGELHGFSRFSFPQRTSPPASASPCCPSSSEFCPRRFLSASLPCSSDHTGNVQRHQ
ncbi:rano class II histocompatibility antigen, A beta chain isoform X1 [Denticeps clupeoides]|uniref:rano class II histocompatibility antigen, A beta chain isoform X1 n=1 Tax=Denticeps clupeoides TaxID=299321 RepID=UPI0010A596B8|nr:rano class II histocompatibility antigen, A beta chain-like isoform X1 [Denticeps clupeoides]